ncbi:hypothetical protein [Sandaracinobacter sp.]|uniref:hypothetical protein n=1 Tax=Sandaracinobacter sp. TaxID=2487581 RepID=UPI0035B263AF
MPDAASEEPAPAADPQGPGRRFELATAISLAVAGLLSAWATYQAGLWDKREAQARATANADLTESSQLMLRAGQEEAMNTAMFLQWLNALADDQPLRADVLRHHFPRAFAPEFERWRKAQPADIRTVPAKSVLPDFTGPSLADARAARRRADLATADADLSGQVGDSYDVANVVLATALFLAGIATVLPGRIARRLPVALAALLTIAALVAMLVTPAQLPGWL